MIGGCQTCESFRPCDCAAVDAALTRYALAVLARNLRDAAGCALAARLQQHASDDEHSWGDGEPPWWPNLLSIPAPGWSR